MDDACILNCVTIIVERLPWGEQKNKMPYWWLATNNVIFAIS